MVAHTTVATGASIPRYGGTEHIKVHQGTVAHRCKHTKVRWHTGASTPRYSGTQVQAHQGTVKKGASTCTSTPRYGGTQVQAHQGMVGGNRGATAAKWLSVAGKHRRCDLDWYCVV